MRKNSDISALRAIDVAMALSLLTRVPIPLRQWPDGRPAAVAAWAYPLAGLLVAMIACGLGLLVGALGMPAVLAAGLVLAVGTVLTGAMHEDGLADCADGFWGGWDVARRLSIMKDSQVGSYGVLALVFATGLRWGALAQIIAQGPWIGAVISAAMVSRATMVMVMYTLPTARPSGLSAKTGRVPGVSALIAVILGVGACILVMGGPALPPILFASIAAIFVAMIAHRKIAGQTGDVLGATQQLSELAFLLTCACLVA